MAINTSPGTPLRHVATYNASGNFVAPAGTNVAFVSMHSSSGGGGGGSGQQAGGPGGTGIVVGSFVQVVPAGVHAVTIGAGGAGSAAGGVNANAGSTGGTTIFDGAFQVTGSNGAVGATRYLTGTIGSAGAGSGTTTLTSLSPSGALIKTGSITTQNTGGFAGGNGGNAGNSRYGGGGGAGNTGASGQVHIYI